MKDGDRLLILLFFVLMIFALMGFRIFEINEHYSIAQQLDAIQTAIATTPESTR